MIKKILKKVTQKIDKCNLWECIKRRDEIRSLNKQIKEIEDTFSLYTLSPFEDYRKIRTLLIIAKKQQKLLKNEIK